MSRRVFTLPDLGEGLTEAELVSWLVEPGDEIAVDHPVAEVETAKATVEVPSPFAGAVAVLHGAPGDTIRVGAPLVSVDPHDSAAGPDAAGGVSADRPGQVLVGYGPSAAPPTRRRRPARTPAPAEPAPALSGRPRVKSPLVRRIARQHGVELGALSGTGPDGVITRGDVERAAAQAAPTTPAAQAAPTTPADTDARTGLPIRTRVPLRGVRGAIATAMARSRREIPEATTWVDVDATALLELRAAMGRDAGPPGLLALVARFVVAGLARYPALNARVDLEHGEVQHLDGVHLGIATTTDRGLVVATVRNAHRHGIRTLDTEIRRLTTAARAGSAAPAELTGSSFTLNNYGVLGVDGSAAIINHPEVAILGLGRIRPRPWVVDGAVTARHVTQLSLAFDHRACDGGTAAGFLRGVADAIEHPISALADL